MGLCAWLEMLWGHKEGFGLQTVKMLDAFKGLLEFDW